MPGKQNILPQLLLAALFTTACNNENSSRPAQGTADSATSIVMESLIDSAYSHFDKAEYAHSLAFAKEVFDIASAANDTDMMAEGLSSMLTGYQQMGILDSAVMAGKALLKIDEASGDPAYLASDYNNIAAIYLTDKNAEEARRFIDKAIKLEESVPGSKKLSIRYGLASEIYNLLGLRNEALSYAEQAYQFDIANGDSLKACRRLSQKGSVLVGMEKYDEAKTAYLSAIEGLEAMGEKHSLGISYRQLGAIYVKSGETDLAVGYIRKAMDIACKTGERNMMMQCYELMSEAYEHKDAEKALAYNKLYTHLRDSLMTTEKDRQLSQLSIQHQTAEKDSIIKDNEETIKSTWLIVAALAAGFILLGFALWKVHKRLRYKARKIEIMKRQIQQQEEEMARQREEFLNVANEQPQSDASESANVRQESETDQAFMESVNEAIFACMTNSDLSAESIARSLDMSAQQLRRKIQEIRGISSKAYIMSVCMEYAKRLLTEKPNLTVAEIAYKCGFDEPAHFTRAFKRETGITPKEYRNKAGT